MPDGGTFVGEFQLGRIQGEGPLRTTQSTSSLSAREVPPFVPRAAGTITWPDGRKYLGEFLDGVRHGFGPPRECRRAAPPASCAPPPPPPRGGGDSRRGGR